MDYAGLQRLTEEQDKAFKNSEEELKKWWFLFKKQFFNNYILKIVT